MLQPPGPPHRRPDEPRASAEPARPSPAIAACCSEEPLLFEIGRLDITGVDVDEPAALRAAARRPRAEGADRPARPLRAGDDAPLRAPVSQKNYGIDTGLFPLGSCTMKHNPRLNEQMARLPGFADIHPLQPVSTVPGRARR